MRVPVCLGHSVPVSRFLFPPISANEKRELSERQGSDKLHISGQEPLFKFQRNSVCHVVLSTLAQRSAV